MKSQVLLLERILVSLGLILSAALILSMTQANATQAVYSTPEGIVNQSSSLAAGEADWFLFLPQVLKPWTDMVLVPAGEFQMGCDPAHNAGYSCSANDVPLHTVFLDDYYMDVFEVTNTQYARCVTAGSCSAPWSNSSYNRSSYYDNPAYANYPVIYVDWDQATAYCAWAGKRLPNEAEWEKAARGLAVRTFPWGDQFPNCALANYNYSCVGDTSEAGSYPLGASPYGALDMAGNVWEWVNDWYQADYYAFSPSSNPPGPASGAYRVMRGGSWGYVWGYLRAADRGNFYTIPFDPSVVGFRCAVSTSNRPPNPASLPIPENGAVHMYQFVELGWTGGDPDGDAVTYHVYFEADDSTPDELVSNNQSNTTFNVGYLTDNTTYYWQIVTRDSHGAISEGPIWNFSTISGWMVLVPAGEFQMGCDPNHNGGYTCDGVELPLHTVNLEAYFIDLFEVTNARYAQCVTAGSCTVPGLNSSNTRASYYNNPTYANYPVIYVNWGKATAYCAWVGKRLPTEAEWEKAARGSSDSQAFPWGDQSPDCSVANSYNNTTGQMCVGDTSEVGSYRVGASPYLAQDMAGNVWEWVNDWYQEDYYGISPYTNPPGPLSGPFKVLRGGGLGSGWNLLRAAYRSYNNPGIGTDDYGFRCAVALEN